MICWAAADDDDEEAWQGSPGQRDKWSSLPENQQGRPVDGDVVGGWFFVLGDDRILLQFTCNYPVNQPVKGIDQEECGRRKETRIFHS